MLEQGQFWRNKALRDHVAVVDEKIAPTLVLKNGTYLNVHTKRWIKANIWLFNERIVYVGDKMPENKEGTEIVDCRDDYIVPGYIEPHSHPTQLFNPEAFGWYAAKYGTTTLLNDNLRLLYLLEKRKAFTLMEKFNELPFSMFWWGRYDSQSKLNDENALFNTNDVISWLNHPSVIQGGELTAWPKLLQGDDRLLYWIQETKRLRKRVEGHFSGASEKTLTKLKLLGASGDHEAINAEEVIRRLNLGYQVAVRYSAVRPDLPEILADLRKQEYDVFDQLMYTTDGMLPDDEDGLIDRCIKIAIEKGVPIIDAYRMATLNVAKYYGFDELLGSITPGRLAHLNILSSKDQPTPHSVIGKGKWIIKDNEEMYPKQIVDWEKLGIESGEFTFDLTEDDLQFSIPIGLKMTSDVLLEPYAVDVDITTNSIHDGIDEAFFVLLSRTGKWRVNTVIKGFTKSLGALCSSFSTTGDLILLGKRKSDMEIAFNRMKEIGGGIVLVHHGEIIYEFKLELGGAMTSGSIEHYKAKKLELNNALFDTGYLFNDPTACLMFLSSSHLPYVRVTPQGIIDVKHNAVVVPANMR